jgi:hypothetical protein
VTLASKRNAIAVVRSAYRSPQFIVIATRPEALEVSAVMSWRTNEAAELIERRLAMTPRSRLIDSLSKSRHPPHTIP